MDTRGRCYEFKGSGFDQIKATARLLIVRTASTFGYGKMGTDDMYLDLAKGGVFQALQQEVEFSFIHLPHYPPVIRRCLSAEFYPPNLGMVNRLRTEPGDS